ncbi:hypothetical protein UFOVP29_298 [uncultured Caudovirales phage]|uniref:Glycine-rich domain-containing protein n=1 Tax=uncultured Caudovirales phage TaxID=2100421 RepID=A0A6J5KSE3_9CAUD|nr:hypothetical protein UFOVP29_298 [uncultured Caudovirales phage]
MTINVNNYDGTTLTTIPDLYLNITSSSLELPGRGLQGYGQAINQDLLWIMQNFARNTQPDSAVTGQHWWDATSGILKIYDGSQWQGAGSIFNSGAAPTNPADGSLWWNTSHTPAQLNISMGGTWQWIGPAGYEYWSSTQNNIPYSNQVYSIGNATLQMASVHSQDLYIYRDTVMGNHLTVNNNSVFTNRVTLQANGSVYSDWVNNNAVADSKQWHRSVDLTTLNEYITTDANTTPKTWLQVTRSGNTVKTIELVTNNNNVAVTVDQAGNVAIANPSGGLIFPDGSRQTYAAFRRTRAYYTSNVFVVPSDCTRARVRVWGAGAGGGGNNDFGSAGGGGGGGYAEGPVVLVPGATIPVTVGLGGVGGSNSAVSLNDGNSGGSSSFGVYLSATGGLGGLGTVAGGAGSGGGGGAGYGSVVWGAGGAGGGGFTIGLSAIGGHGGAAAMGGGGGSNGGYAGPGAFPGGGGAGAANDTAGGSGAPGMVVVEY